MLPMSRTTATNFWVPSSYQNRKETIIRSENGSVAFKLPSRTFLVSSETANSASLHRTIHHRTPGKNIEILKYCEVGNLKEAMDLLCSSGESDIESRTYCSILQLCADLRSLSDGRKVHSIICGNGIEIDSILGTKLVYMYVTCGDLGVGRRVFDMIANEKVFLWNLFINEYAKIGRFEESVYLYKRMQQLGVEANSHTFSCILKCIASLGSVVAGEQVHGYLLRSGFGSSNTVVNSLIAFYFRCKRIESARKLFDGLHDRDIISWNSMISGYVTNGLSETGLQIFEKMLLSVVSTDLVTLVSVLTACADIGSFMLGRAVHAYAVKAGLDKKISFSNTLLDVYSKCGDTESSINIFKNMGERNVVSWTTMIAGYARQGLSDKAIELFCEMKSEGIKPDTYCITSVLHACACNGSLDKGKDVHNLIKENEMHLNLSVSNALMDMYVKCGSIEDAQYVFSQMPKKDIISWNTMIGGYSKICLPNKALNLFVQMQNELKPDDVTMSCILPACASLAALDRGREIHAYILRNGLSSDRYVANALVDMYVKCGVLVLARLIFYTMATRDLISWTVMIAGYGMHGFGNKAISTFDEMKQAGIKPDEVSFISILYACSHSGLLKEGWKFFNVMQNEYDIEPKLEHYACMVDLLARAGKLSLAYKFIKAMPIQPDATTWGALLCGCRSYRDVKLAEKVAEHVFELEPENTGYYVLLANIYAEAEKWEEVKALRERIGRRGLRKNPGCSWIEVKGRVHIFLAGHNAHPQAKKVEPFLQKLRVKMKEEGYVPNFRYALVNADEMKKEAALCGHSEKMAIAFGILNSPPGKTIRVTKNLRVCSDCHEMAKFMSRTVGTEIVLRDSNRFHHFKDGYCSCRGYW